LNLPKEVIESEFPNLKLQSPDGKKVVMTFKNGQSVVIGTEQPDGTYDSEVYEFSDVNDDVVFPKSPEFPDFLAKLSLDKFDGVANSDARDDYNNNVKHIETTVNSLVDYSVNQKGYFSKLKDTLSDVKGFVSKIISIQVSKFMHDNVETKYYSKVDADKKFKYLQDQIDNLSNAITYKPAPGGVFPPSYTGDKNIDVNDKIYDPNVAQKIDELNSLYDEKGDNN